MTDISAVIDPERYADALRQAKDVLERKLAAQLVERQLLQESPVWTDDEKKAGTQGLDRVVADLEWRLEEVADALKAHAELKELVALPRAERRRRLAEIQAEKELKESDTGSEEG